MERGGIESEEWTRCHSTSPLELYGDGWCHKSNEPNPDIHDSRGNIEGLVIGEPEKADHRGNAPIWSDRPTLWAMEE